MSRYFVYHRSSELFRLERNSGYHLIQAPSSSRVIHSRFLRTMCNQVSSISKEGDFTTSLRVLVWAGIVNCLHSSSYGSMFWICDQNNVDNRRMFHLLLSSAYRVRAFSGSHAALPASFLHKNTGRGHSWPKLIQGIFHVM